MTAGLPHSLFPARPDAFGFDQIPPGGYNMLYEASFNGSGGSKWNPPGGHEDGFRKIKEKYDQNYAHAIVEDRPIWRCDQDPIDAAGEAGSDIVVFGDASGGPHDPGDERSPGDSTRRRVIIGDVRSIIDRSDFDSCIVTADIISTILHELSSPCPLRPFRRLPVGFTQNTERFSSASFFLPFVHVLQLDAAPSDIYIVRSIDEVLIISSCETRTVFSSMSLYSTRISVTPPLSPSTLCPLPKDINGADVRPGRPGGVRVKCGHPDAFSYYKNGQLSESVRAVRVKSNISHMRAGACARARYFSISDSIFPFYSKTPGRLGRKGLTVRMHD
jgi:hypothetical protein